MVSYRYPLFQPAVVGLSAGKMKTLTPADMQALCDAFHILTDMDALGEKAPADQWADFLEWKRQRRS